MEFNIIINVILKYVNVTLTKNEFERHFSESKEAGCKRKCVHGKHELP
jgi:hypothetical protein